MAVWFFKCSGIVRFVIAPEIAQKIRHGRRADQVGAPEREIADCANLLLELTGLAGFDG